MKANPKLIKGCKLWDKVSAKANRGQYPIPKEIDNYEGRTLYSAEDYAALECVIMDNVAELQVGGTTGHKARVNLDEKTLDYLDWRGQNNWEMWELFNALGLQCKRDEVGVHCKNISTQTQVNKVFKALTVPASMDYRRSHCVGFSDTEQCRKATVKYFLKGPLKEK